MASLWSYGYLVRFYKHTLKKTTIFLAITNLFIARHFFPQEELFGHLVYAKYTFLLILLSFIVQGVIYKLLISYWNMESYRDMMAIGYSW